MKEIKKYAQKEVDKIAVALLKGNYILKEFTQSQDFGCMPTHEYGIVTSSGAEISVEVVVHGDGR